MSSKLPRLTGEVSSTNFICIDILTNVKLVLELEYE